MEKYFLWNNYTISVFHLQIVSQLWEASFEAFKKYLRAGYNSLSHTILVTVLICSGECYMFKEWVLANTSIKLKNKMLFQQYLAHGRVSINVFQISLTDLEEMLYCYLVNIFE